MGERRLNIEVKYFIINFLQIISIYTLHNEKYLNNYYSIGTLDNWEKDDSSSHPRELIFVVRGRAI